MGDIGKWAPHVGGKNIKNLLRAWGKSLDAKLAVEKNGPDVGRGHQVGQVRVRAAQFLDAALQLVIDRDQLLVDGLQFLFARFELFRRGAHFLICGLKLFIGGFQFFVRGFVLLNGRTELVLQMLNFQVELAGDGLVPDRCRSG